jgi:hypothetical protein
MKYIDYLIAIACEKPHESQAIEDPFIRDPANFFQALYLYAARTQKPITREGTDRLMDLLFRHEDMQPLLDQQTATNFQNEFAALYLPTLTPAYQSFWTHIVLPAWSQHQDIYHTLKETTV